MSLQILLLNYNTILNQNYSYYILQQSLPKKRLHVAIQMLRDSDMDCLNLVSDLAGDKS